MRLIKISMVASIALFFSLVAYNNIVNFNGNWPFVQHVLSMDTTFRDPAVMWRAITNSTIQKYAYCFIITWETLTALICWAGCFFLLARIKRSPAQFEQAKLIAYIGLFFGFLLYMVGFIVIAGEWFNMWQSADWNGQKAAAMFLSLILFVMLFLKD